MVGESWCWVWESLLVVEYIHARFSLTFVKVVRSPVFSRSTRHLGIQADRILKRVNPSKFSIKFLVTCMDIIVFVKF